ncbi:Alanine--tRNA ligase [Candidatus Hepatincola sp. Av]
MFRVNDVRKLFLNYFIKKNHQHLESASLIPKNDDTLLFTNSGMVPFKNIFMGLDEAKFNKVTSVQKCLRAGGKHNDLDNVGYTARHHTFFEMLGNFSFGDYFKEEAIYYAWDFLTKELALNKDKLLVTIFHEDEEAAKLWHKIAGLDDSKILRIKGSDNFWEMADVGPCGPCTEVFYDRGENIQGGLPGSIDEGDRYMEIWNLVFMQFERLANGKMRNLQKPCIDTGMGLERIVAVLQNVPDNYEIDLFKNLILATNDILKVKSTSNNINAFKVIADHIRASSFLIAEGILPSNEGRGYVLRRIIRRAVRYLYLLGVKEPSLYKLVVPLKNEMGVAYKELALREQFIQETIKLEEEKFSSTFAKGLTILQEEVVNNPSKELSGSFAFKLYDTYGFPLDLTKDVLKNKKIKVDEAGFNKAFARHKELAKESWVGSGEVLEDDVWHSLAKKLKPSIKTSHYVLKTESTLQIIMMPNSESSNDALNKSTYIMPTINEPDADYLDRVSDVFNNKLPSGGGTSIPALHTVEGEDKLCYLVFNKTPFYYEKGGQVADNGFISGKGNTLAKVLDVQQKAEGLIVHKCLLIQGELKEGEEFTLEVDVKERKAIQANHTTAHLLHSALAKYVGNHVSQKGSFLNGQRLRFDFFHPKPLTKEEIQLVEKAVNTTILQNLPVIVKNMEQKEALAKGAIALFGEKYPKIVTTVKIGEKDNELYSFELCGGTHVQHTGEIGMFKILSESSISSGVRRVEAITGQSVYKYLEKLDTRVKELSKLLNTDINSIENKITSLSETYREVNKKYQRLSHKYNTILLTQNIKEFEHIKTICLQVEDVAMKEMRTLISNFPQATNIVILLYATQNNRASFVLSVPTQYTKNISLNLKEKFLEILEGNGGGNLGNLQGSGNPEKIPEAFKYIVANLK